MGASERLDVTKSVACQEACQSPRRPGYCVAGRVERSRPAGWFQRHLARGRVGGRSVARDRKSRRSVIAPIMFRQTPEQAAQPAR